MVTMYVPTTLQGLLVMLNDSWRRRFQRKSRIGFGVMFMWLNGQTSLGLKHLSSFSGTERFMQEAMVILLMGQNIEIIKTTITPY